jgi:hypothetical protein
MRTIRIDAEQGHDIPTRAYEARGPFAPVIPKVGEIEYDPDWFPPGATAQNNMQGRPVFECRTCQAILFEEELDGHVCEGDL